MEEQDPGSGNEKRGAGHVMWGIAIVAVFILVFGFFVQLLWNWLMPGIFGINSISYLQAVGLLLLSRILFGRTGQRRDHAGYLTGKYGFRSLMGRGRSEERSSDNLRNS